VGIRASHTNAALIVLAIGVLRFYGYVPFDPELRGIVSKGLGGLCMVLVAPYLYIAYPSKAMLAVLAWWVFESMQVVICSTAYAIKPWDVPVGQSICSSRLDFDLGAIGALLIGLILWRIVLRLPLK
jgi:hypothetical protein